MLSFGSTQRKAIYETARREIGTEEREASLDAREKALKERVLDLQKQIQSHQMRCLERERHIGKLKEGTSFIKHRHGKAKKRFLWLTDNQLHLCWSDSCRKDKLKNCLFVYDIKGVSLGTRGFASSLKSSSNIDDLCLTIIHAELSLDVQFESSLERNEWADALREICHPQNPLRGG
eukprot:TRINITY_DN4394_c0_g1_i3.p1 TRINITY_DN4394_c0_g1~~TRINITY_DN4394_c0_g1_i3.p1  ORF type:complete len:177 (+),score=25.71 TRINITY_DN4394_c0_g1_i3:890-1420(+)